MLNYSKNAYNKPQFQRLTFQELLNLIATKTSSNPRLSGRSYIALCPAHDDRHTSLSAREAEDAKILLRCFAGCSIHEICASLGIQVKDLFPTKNKGAYRG